MKNLYADSRVSFLQACALLVVSICVIVLRYPPFLLQPRMWAEESMYYETFFSNPSILDGFDSVVYPAYYLLISRIAGLLASFVDPANAALVTTLCGLIVLLIPLIIIIFGRSMYWSAMHQKIILSAFLIFSCSTGEIWMNSTNVGFIMSVVTFLILIDENPGNYYKKSLYMLLLFLAILTGPISLLMSPFFLYRFLQKKEPVYLIYCSLFLILGLFQISYFLVSHNLEIPVGTTNRGIFMQSSIMDSFFYWISPNILFPILGYFVSNGFKTLAVLGSQNPEQLISMSQSLPYNFSEAIGLAVFLLPMLVIILGGIVLALYVYFFRHSDSNERVYLLILFAYLSILLTVLSLGGQGGIRYSYVTSFILMFFLLQRFALLKSGIERNIIKTIVSLSLLIGVLEYYPRVISFSPDFRSSQESEWPNWKNEVAIWKENPSHQVRIWPHLRKDTNIWPARSEVWTVDLSNDKTWDFKGGFRYSEELSNFFQDSSN